MTFRLCDPGWYVHKPDVQNKWDDNIHMHTHTHNRMITGTGTGTEARTVAEMGTGTRVTGTGTRIGSGRAEERRRSARNRKIVVDAKWETGETWVERGKNVE